MTVTPEQKKRLLKAKIAVALQDELGRVPKEDEINQVFMLTRVMYKSPAEKKSNDSKGLHSSPSAASRDSKADQRRLTVKALGSRGLPTLKLPNQRCQAQRCEIADFLFGRALRATVWG